MGRGAVLCIVLAGLLSASGAQAVIPAANKVSDELARTNRAAKRAEPLIFDVKLHIGDGAPLADGVLATHPTGLARLELRSHRGFVERHLLQGNEYSASRDGSLLSSPRPFLPPLFLLQATSGATLRAALSSFGVATSEIVLGTADDRDCYVLGGRLPYGTEQAGQGLPSVWIDMDSFQLVRVDRRDGVSFRFGPLQVFEGIQAPSWISIEVPGQLPARLEVERVAPANAPAAAFGHDWLMGGVKP
ncbi:MAG: hypothetical protein JRH16_10040 [Deltaproteobacteria bacterium]|nr:hypothetical protein [Deltaproteobacteria bacterium]MBW2360789.1 hypothetical protein [Deltaproteobacteria bacterium]